MFTKGHGNDPALLARQGFYVDPPPPEKVGREVARVFKAYAFERAGKPKRNQRLRTREVLRTMVADARKLAQALGDQSSLIYPVPPPRKVDDEVESSEAGDAKSGWLSQLAARIERGKRDGESSETRGAADPNARAAPTARTRRRSKRLKAERSHVRTNFR